jgi:hypothetical protein
MKKLIVGLAVVVGLALCPLAANAQAAGGGFQLLSFDIGYAPAYNTSTSALSYSSLFALNIKVANDLIVGFESLGTSTASSFLTLKYNFLPILRGTLAFGNAPGTTLITGSGAVIGFGFEAVPFARTVGGSVSTEFKLIMQYLARADTVTTNSALLFGIAFGVGM